jgi:hypothetical protein
MSDGGFLLEPNPKSDSLHDNAAVGMGGRIAWQYAWDLVAGGAKRDYVMRALLARRVDPDTAKDLVLMVFEARKADYARRGRGFVWTSLPVLVIAVAVTALTKLQGERLGAPDFDTFLCCVRRASLPAAAGLGLLLWGCGLLRRSARL